MEKLKRYLQYKSHEINYALIYFIFKITLTIGLLMKKNNNVLIGYIMSVNIGWFAYSVFDFANYNLQELILCMGTLIPICLSSLILLRNKNIYDSYIKYYSLFIFIYGLVGIYITIRDGATYTSPYIAPVGIITDFILLYCAINLFFSKSENK